MIDDEYTTDTYLGGRIAPRGGGSRTTATSDPIVNAARCPACKSAEGVKCRTVIDGTDTGWTHDARVYAHIAQEKGR